MGVKRESIAGVVLAGGQARRLGGGDKCLKLLGGAVILSHVLERLTPQVGCVVLNANGDAARFGAMTSCPVIADSIAGFVGPLGGVLAGMDWAAARSYNYILTVAADTPFFPLDLAERLAQEISSPDTIIMARSADAKKEGQKDRQNIHPTFALWPTSLREDLREKLNQGLRKILDWSDQHKTKTACFDTEPFDPFFNINTPEDMATAETLYQEWIK